MMTPETGNFFRQPDVAKIVSELVAKFSDAQFALCRNGLLCARVESDLFCLLGVGPDTVRQATEYLSGRDSLDEYDKARRRDAFALALAEHRVWEPEDVAQTQEPIISCWPATSDAERQPVGGVDINSDTFKLHYYGIVNVERPTARRR